MRVEIDSSPDATHNIRRVQLSSAVGVMGTYISHPSMLLASNYRAWRTRVRLEFISSMSRIRVESEHGVAEHWPLKSVSSGPGPK